MVIDVVDVVDVVVFFVLLLLWHTVNCVTEPAPRSEWHGVESERDGVSRVE